MPLLAKSKEFYAVLFPWEVSSLVLRSLLNALFHVFLEPRTGGHKNEINRSSKRIMSSSICSFNLENGLRLIDVSFFPPENNEVDSKTGKRLSLISGRKKERKYSLGAVFKSVQGQKEQQRLIGEKEPILAFFSFPLTNRF